MLNRFPPARWIGWLADCVCSLQVIPIGTVSTLAGETITSRRLPAAVSIRYSQYVSAKHYSSHGCRAYLGNFLWRLFPSPQFACAHARGSKLYTQRRALNRAVWSKQHYNTYSGIVVVISVGESVASQSKLFLLYCINSSCKLFLSIIIHFHY